jgi:hypothetical protein
VTTGSPSNPALHLNVEAFTLHTHATLEPIQAPQIRACIASTSAHAHMCAAPTMGSSKRPPTSPTRRPSATLFVEAGQRGRTVPRGLSAIETSLSDAPLLKFRSDRPYESREEADRRGVAAVAQRGTLDAQVAARRQQRGERLQAEQIARHTKVRLSCSLLPQDNFAQ